MNFLKSICILFLLIVVSTAVRAQGQNNIDLANQYASTGDCEKAVIYFEKWYSADPYNAYQPYLNCLIALKDYKNAEKLIKKQIKKSPANSVLWVDLGTLYETQGELSDAKQQYEKAIKSLFPDVQQILSLGAAFIEKRKLDYAEITYLEGRKMVNGAYPFSFELADVYGQLQQPQKMVDEYIGILDFNESYLPNLQAILQNKMAFDLEGGLSDIIRTSLLRKTQKGNQNPIYNELLFWLVLQEKDFETAFIQAKALDKRNDENGSRLISLGKLCVTNQQYAIAENCFNYVISKGKMNSNYITARIEIIAAQDQKITSSGNYTPADLQKLEQDYETTLTELGKNQISAPLISNYAHLKAFYLNKTDEAVTLLEEALAMPRNSPLFLAQCKLELGDILILKNEVWDASLYYSQVDKDFKNDAIGREAKFRNARLSYYMGEFEWAAAQLNVLKAATSQLISNDAMQLGLLIIDNLGLDGDSNITPLLIYSRADLLEFCNQNDKALVTLDSIVTEFPTHSLMDEIWYKKAGIYYKKGDFAKAADLWFKIFETYPDDILGDDALYKLADLTETKLNENVRAKELFEMLLTKYPGSLYAVDARKRYRILRGDGLN
ncbi:MAG: tetratricopeptide repeat protein [Bacteroidetes bacterium]|nr:tetratricopeptide repeat protein [Bacteroidota bacterium]